MQHQVDLAHHVRQGEAWLSQCAGGDNTAALSYAAFELRFAVERLALHYWVILLNREPETDDLRDLQSFKRIERRIYELGGHQQEINRHFEFIRIIIDELKITMPLHTPKIGALSNYWHRCSEFCHIAWPLSSSVPEGRAAALAALTEIAASLSDQVQSLGWPIIHHPDYIDLRNRFISNQATSEDVVTLVQRTGIYAVIEPTDGTAPHSVGESIPPKSTQT